MCGQRTYVTMTICHERCTSSSRCAGYGIQTLGTLSVSVTARGKRVYTLLGTKRPARWCYWGSKLIRLVKQKHILVSLALTYSPMFAPCSGVIFTQNIFVSKSKLWNCKLCTPWINFIGYCSSLMSADIGIEWQAYWSKLEQPDIEHNIVRIK